MGIHGLTKFLKDNAPEAVVTKSYAELGAYLTADGGVPCVGVDVSSYLYPAQYNKAAKGKGSYIRTFLDMIVTFWGAGLSVVFVFDGDTYTPAKKATIDKRSEVRQKKTDDLIKVMNRVAGSAEASPVATESGATVVLSRAELSTLSRAMVGKNMGTEEDRAELARLEKQNISVTNNEIECLIYLFESLGVPYLCAPHEADGLLACLYRNGYISAVVSEDRDMLVHGVNLLICGLIDAGLRGSGSVMVFRLDETLSGLKLTMGQFVDLCILMGCDYCTKLSGIAAGKGLPLVRYHGSLKTVIGAIRSGTLKYQPDGATIDEFEHGYDEALIKFSGEDEDLTHLVPAAVVLEDGYPISDPAVLILWLLETTNYTEPTVRSKISVLSGPAGLGPEPRARGPFLKKPVSTLQTAPSATGATAEVEPTPAAPPVKVRVHVRKIVNPK